MNEQTARVVIVGRPNVGKSSLFNQLIKRRLSIVDNREGVTRDRLEAHVELAEGHAIRLLDTGGMGLQHEDTKKFELNDQIDAAVENADVFIFVCDIRAGVSSMDKQIAERLRQSKKPILLLVNKADTPDLEMSSIDFWELGLEEPIAYSVNEAKGRKDLIERLIDLTPKVAMQDDSELPRVALLGKRNSGKSTLLNLMSKEQRVIVSNIPGTTRDFVEVRIDHYSHPFIAVDTAGMKKGNYEDPVDFFSIKRTETALRECQAAILMIDATDKLTGIDKKLAEVLRRFAKPTLVAVNKWDLVPSDVKSGDYMEYIDKQMTGIPYAPVAFVSALKGDNIRQMIKTLFDLIDQGSKRLGTGQLNRLLDELTSKKSPPSRGGRQAKFFYVTQTSVCPPTFVFMCNDGRLVSKSYQRYIENFFRKSLNIPEIPLKFVFRGKDETKKS